METNFNFKSQVCTSVEQSRRLLKLGLKKETADMHWFYTGDLFGWQSSTQSYMEAIECASGTNWTEDGSIIPAWSLGRLIKDLMPQSIGHLELAVGSNYTGYYEDRWESELGMWWEYSSETPDMFDNIISTIDWLIKEGYFPKEYLV